MAVEVLGEVYQEFVDLGLDAEHPRVELSIQINNLPQTIHIPLHILIEHPQNRALVRNLKQPLIFVRPY